MPTTLLSQAWEPLGFALNYGKKGMFPAESSGCGIRFSSPTCGSTACRSLCPEYMGRQDYGKRAKYPLPLCTPYPSQGT